MSKVCHDRCFPGMIRIARIKITIQVPARGGCIDLQIIVLLVEKLGGPDKHPHLVSEKRHFHGVIYDSPHMKFGFQ